jgi:N-acetylmuramoyl-L-alanine amidase
VRPSRNWILRKTKGWAVQIEPAFLNKPLDRYLIARQGFAKDCGMAIAAGADDWAKHG